MCATRWPPARWSAGWCCWHPLAGGIGADFHFGAGSRQAFASQYPAMAEIRRTGLSHDLDTPQDLAALRAMGWHDEAPR